MNIPLKNLTFAIQKHDPIKIQNLLGGISLKMGLEIFSTKKISNLFTSGNNLYFLYQVFQTIAKLPIFSYLELLKCYPDRYEIEAHQHISIHQKKFNHQPLQEILQNFVIHSIDLFIFKQSHKKFTQQDFQLLIKIGQQFNIPNTKVVNWIAKSMIASNSIEMMKDSFSLPLFQNKIIQRKYISHLLNGTENIKFLNALFSLKEKEIYDIYAELKIHQNIWSFLSMKKNEYGSFLPHVSQEKLSWFEEKNIGYKNSNNYFELFKLNYEYKTKNLHSFLLSVFSSEEKDYYQNLIYNAIQKYEREIIPIKKEYILQFENSQHPHHNFQHSKEYQKFLSWIQDSSEKQCLYLFNDESFYQECKKIYFTIFLQDKLTQNTSTNKNIKI